MAALPLLGFGFGHWEYALKLRNFDSVVLVTISWLLLHVGAMWLNADFDRDTGAVLFGFETVEVPPFTWSLGICSLGLGTGLALVADPAAGAYAAGCGGLAVAYSSSSLAWKAHAVGGPVVNAVGYGFLSPAAGWSLVHVLPTPRTIVASIIAVAFILSLYFAAQAFQADEDRARGYRTLVATHGPRRTLQVSRVLLACGCILLLGMVIADWLPKLCGLILPAWIACDRWVSSWQRESRGGTRHHAEGYVVRLLVLGLVTFLAAVADLGIDRARGTEPVAGLATAVGGQTRR